MIWNLNAAVTVTAKAKARVAAVIVFVVFFVVEKVIVASVTKFSKHRKNKEHSTSKKENKIFPMHALCIGSGGWKFYKGPTWYGTLHAVGK